MDSKVKFGAVVGNPPYQGENVGDKTSPPAIYNFFMEESYKIGSKVCLITPARFLFNTGRTPKKWNRKMLSDQHLKVLSYESESSKVFSNTTIKGGVVITYRDKDRILGPISTFTAYSELNTILKKTEYDDSDKLSDITYSQAIYKFTDTMHKEKPETLDILSKGNESVVGTGVLNSLDKLIFWKNKPNDGNNYIKIAGLYEKARVYRWVRKEYINNPANLEKWKVLLPQANGSGTLGEVLSSPIIGKPLVGHTQTFISIGAFNTKEEAQACLKYIKTKFTRVLLGVLKATQHNPPRTWSKIPLQDFTMNSDIDWTKSIAEIDQQLYKKYGLDEEEINFIESNVKGMER